MRFPRFASSLAAVILVCSAAGSSALPSSPWPDLEFLIGTWATSDPNQLGAGEGAATFSVELNGQVIVRRSFAAYSSGPSAGTRHDDLLIIFRDAPGAPPRAVYFDSEGHVIRYTITAQGGHSAVFESDPSQAGPRYRLSYTRTGETLTGLFEIAPPGAADYKTYLSWTTTRR